MRVHIAVTILLVAVFCSGVAFGQGGNGTLTGTVEDASKAVIPGVTITALNTNTGVTTTAISNETGSFNIPGLLPGTYRLTATLPGFQTQNFNNIELGTNETKRYNFSLQIASLATQVDVSVDASTLLTTQGANVGEVLQEGRVRDLPLVSGDVLDLVRIMPGVRTGPGGDVTSFAGLSPDTVNTVRDGLSVTDGRYANGIYGSTTINPELVGEIRLILTPVDAELGRGNGQVQITTRSGTNRYTGTAVWNVRNTALNANTWDNNNDIVGGVWTPTQPDWFNENQVTLTFGGPIVRNKTFFFGQYDRQFRNQRTIVTGTTMTNSAKQGIYRYWEGWNPGNANAALPAGNGTTIAAVDFDGNPLRPFRAQGQTAFNNNTPYTGQLRCVSVFGTTKADGSPFTAADCPGGQIVLPSSSEQSWDPNRPVIDPTGFIRRFLDFMPTANYFGTGDGLNTAGVRYMRGNNANQGGAFGINTTQLQTGQNINADRDQFNIKIDQSFTASHKASVGYTYEISGGSDFVGFWPTQFVGETKRTPHVFTSNLTSTLSPTLLNEARFGIRITKTESNAAWEHSNEQVRDGARQFFLQGGNSLYGNNEPLPALFTPGAGIFQWSGDNSPFDTGAVYLGNFNPLYNLADTVRWTKGVHALRLGGDVRITRSNGYNFLPYNIPRLSGGAGNLPGSATGIFMASETNGMPGVLQTARDNMRNLLYFFAGSVQSGNMGYWIDSPDDVTDNHWEDYSTKHRKYRDQRQNEYAAFFQDDWKVTRRLTLNLGLRYEYYGVPYLKGGFTSAPVGLAEGLFGVGRVAEGSVFNNWLYPGNIFLTGYGGTGAGISTASNALRCVTGQQQNANLPVSTCDPNLLTQLEFVGPDSPNPDKGVFKRDLDNFGPNIGFAYQVPWFGEGKTTVRGGYSITYGGAGRNGIALDGILGGAPGAVHTANLVLSNFVNPDNSPEYLNLTKVQRMVPMPPTQVPGGTFSVYGKTGTFTAYNGNWETPYTQNFNLSVTRTLTRRITLDMRYVGTMGKKLSGNLNLNEVNVFNNQELFDALETVRAGGESPLFDQMFAGLNLNPGITGYGAVGTTVNNVLQTGALHLRRWGQSISNITVSQHLANGNYEAVAEALNGNGGGLTFLPIPTGMGTIGSRILRNGCDRIATGLTTVNTVNGPIPLRCFPENFITMNPQLDDATYIHNNGYSKYHSLQTSVTLRPTAGLNFTANYTWSKTMALASSGHRDLRNRAADYTLSGNHLTHDFRANGSFELPIGPNKLLFGSSSGLLARLIERWQTSFIFNVYTGRPVSITGQQTLWSGGNPDVVSSWDVRGGHTEWGVPVGSQGQLGGTYFGNPSPFMKVQDPQCAPGGLVDHTDAMGFNLRGNVSTTSGQFVDLCTLDALADASTGQILLQNPRPGQLGTLGTMTMQTRGVWSLDGNVSKSFAISESKNVQIRVDATNILNHPTPPDPTLNINSNTAFGLMTGDKSGSRQFRGTLRLVF